MANHSRQPWPTVAGDGRNSPAMVNSRRKLLEYLSSHRIRKNNQRKCHFLQICRRLSLDSYRSSGICCKRAFMHHMSLCRKDDIFTRKSTKFDIFHSCHLRQHHPPMYWSCWIRPSLTRSTREWEDFVDWR